MKKIVKKILACIMLISIVGCGSSGINLKKIEIEGNDTVESGDRAYYIMLKNNTNYDVFDITVKYTLDTDNHTDKELMDAFGEEDKDNLDQAKSEGLSIPYYGYVSKGEEVELTNNWYESVSATPDEAYNMMKMDLITVKYVNKDKVQEVTYDYGNKKTTNGKSTDLIEWSDKNKYAKIGVKPTKGICQITYDSDYQYEYTLYNVTKDDYEQLIDSYAKKGFDEDADESDSDYYGYVDYSGYNSDRNSVHIYYYESSKIMTVRIG